MKKFQHTAMKFALPLCMIILFGACKKNTDSPVSPFAGLSYQTEDQMGRPAINTVFNLGADKDAFNIAIPSGMGAAFQSKFQSRLLALNAGYTTNALGQSASAFTGLLATDVINVSTTVTTTFFDGTNVLTGRALADDVIDTELLLIFGGSAGTSNPGLTSDKVNANDKPFLAAFPYLASPW
jgi:uridylate kinase